MRSRLIAAAVGCDYAALERLGLKGSTDFHATSSSGAKAARPAAPGKYWRAEEAKGHAPLRKLVALLHLPVATGGVVCSNGCHANFYWPRASQEFDDATPKELATLRSLYGDALVSRAQESRRYGGMHLIGINDAGDWFYFAIEDGEGTPSAPVPAT